MIKCPKCKKTDRVYKYGKRNAWKNGHKKVVQAYFCDNCGYQWRDK